MGAETKIEWCHHTFNPWWGCQRVSPGCEHCYAEAFAKRVGQKVWGAETGRRLFGDKYWAEPVKWNKDARAAGERRRVFCASMADVFEDRGDLASQREHLWRLIGATEWLDWLLLTKRPENMVKMAPASWGQRWPRNVWAGTTVENQKAAEKRIPWLIEVPAAVRFLSCEPLLEAVNLDDVEPYYLQRDPHPHDPKVRLDCLRGHVKGPDDVVDEFRIQWVIVGGESGPGARPFCLSWAYNIISDCEETGVPVFVKQLGAHPYRVTDEAEDLNVYHPNDVAEWYRLKDRKGGTMSEWPSEYLRKREFPEVRP